MFAVALGKVCCGVQHHQKTEKDHRKADERANPVDEYAKYFYCVPSAAKHGSVEAHKAECAVFGHTCVEVCQTKGRAACRGGKGNHQRQRPCRAIRQTGGEQRADERYQDCCQCNFIHDFFLDALELAEVKDKCQGRHAKTRPCDTRRQQKAPTGKAVFIQRCQYKDGQQL